MRQTRCPAGQEQEKKDRGPQTQTNLTSPSSPMSMQMLSLKNGNRRFPLFS
jgi:hypothetical protein